MSALVPVTASGQPSVRVTLAPGTPSVEELFTFARDAERRFGSLRMRIEERVITARGEELTIHEVLIRHPGMARVDRRSSEEPLSRDYDVWIGDGETVRSYAARDRRASVRGRPARLVGADRADLPGFARLREPLTALPPESLPETFVHPHGLMRNVLVTGALTVLGTAPIGEREAWVVRADRPRSTLVLTDRPDRWLEVGFDRQTGLLLLLVEHVGETVTRHAEVTSLDLDPTIPDEAFRLHLGADVRVLF
jgi:hypothetical protein